MYDDIVCLLIPINQIPLDERMKHLHCQYGNEYGIALRWHPLYMKRSELWDGYDSCPPISTRILGFNTY